MREDYRTEVHLGSQLTAARCQLLHHAMLCCVLSALPAQSPPHPPTHPLTPPTTSTPPPPASWCQRTHIVKAGLAARDQGVGTQIGGLVGGGGDPADDGHCRGGWVGGWVLCWQILTDRQLGWRRWGSCSWWSLQERG